MVFQPIVTADTGDVFAYEALTRCSLEQFANPALLFDQAALQGDAGRLGSIARKLAVETSGGKKLFLNVHPSELRSDCLLRESDAIYHHDAPVFLELTEAASLSGDDEALDRLKRIRARGSVLLAVDDFGAGYSNLQRLLDLHPAFVKLDRAMITGLDRKPRHQRVVQAMVELCRDLGASVVAEGVETEDELKAVVDAGANFVQGYLLARPAAPHPAVTWPESMPRVSIPATSGLRGPARTPSQAALEAVSQ